MTGTGVMWQRAPACNAGDCVEVGSGDGAILLRDSKDPDGPVLSFSPAEWDAFLGGAKLGDFDRFVRQPMA